MCVCVNCSRIRSVPSCESGVECVEHIKVAGMIDTTSECNRSAKHQQASFTSARLTFPLVQTFVSFFLCYNTIITTSAALSWTARTAVSELSGFASNEVANHEELSVGGASLT